MAEPAIQVQGLTKTYRDGTSALQDVSFQVRQGEIFGLLGPNGAGKTTLMKVLGTLHKATRGRARVLGMDLPRHAAALRRRIGFAMQEVGMDDLATAHEMLVLHARLYGLPLGEARTRAAELLDAFGLADHAHRRVSRFSGGMQRRLDLAVSLAHRPAVLFLDEPSTGLDPTSRAGLWQTLRRLRREEGLTVLLSTHYMEEADALCDRVAIIHEGRLSAIDTPGRLKRSVGGHVVQVRLDQAPGPEALGRLQKRLGPSVRADRRTVTVVAQDEEALLPVLRAVEACGLRPAAVRSRGPTLDDVFLHYTGGRLQDPGSSGPEGGAP